MVRTFFSWHRWWFLFWLPTVCQGQPLQEVRRFTVAEAQQGIAVDAQHFYVVNNDYITKHTKQDGRQVAYWKDTTGLITHLNSGIIIQDRLYCANTNYPASPMLSSVEIFDPHTMEHLGNHSFGLYEGSLTWIDWHDSAWWASFAHYSGEGATEGKDHRWTHLVKFDPQWRRLASWAFPDTLLAAFAPKSNSGGLWGPDNTLYCTGHDAPTLYMLKLPSRGFTLELVQTLPIPAQGQGIALDRVGDTLHLYTILRKARQVVVSEFKHEP